MTRGIFFVTFALLFFSGSVTHAHPAGIEGGTTNIVVDAQPYTFTSLIRFSEVTQEEYATDIENITRYFTEGISFSVGGERCAVTVSEYAVEYIADRYAQNARFTGEIDCPGGDLSIVDDGQPVPTLPQDHWVTVSRAGETFFAFSLTAHPGLVRLSEFSLSEGSIETPKGTLYGIVMRFLVLGIEHIVFGYDHLLFLIAGVLLLSRARDVFVLVTGFTLAHSLTLILATLGVIAVVSNIVEPIIALSIAVVAGLNVWTLYSRSEPEVRVRWIVVTMFGFLHGMGFAGALSEIEIPSVFFIPALLSFNLGIEAGQVLVLLFVLPLLWMLKYYRVTWYRQVCLAVSALIVLVALYWVIERLA